ncbi:MAG TPA: phosphotransferase, partial [Blastocatellia bacterium]|nr:phosphotransferase [Blastocatellia bacterium]
LTGFKRVLDQIRKVDLVADQRAITAYLESLLRSAEDADRRDAFSKAALFDESEYPIESSETLQTLIKAVRHVIEKHVELESLKRLAVELIELLRRRQFDADKKRVVNALIKEVKQGLAFRTSAVQVKDVDLYAIAMDKLRVARFNEIVRGLREEAVIHQESLQGFKIEVRKHAFSGAGEVKQASGTRLSFSEAFRKYSDAYAYLRELMQIEGLSVADF